MHIEVVCQIATVILFLDVNISDLHSWNENFVWRKGLESVVYGCVSLTLNRRSADTLPIL